MSQIRKHLFFALVSLVSLTILQAQDSLMTSYYAGSYSRVITLAREAITAGDTSVTTFYLKALSEDQLGQIPEAIRTLEGALDQHPGDTRLSRMLATLYTKAGDFTKAQDHYTLLVARDSNDVSSWLELAEIASFRQENKEAIAALQEVLRIDSINLEGLMMMGNILNRNNNTGAVIYYEAALRLYPENQKAAYALANWYIKANRPQKALSVCQSILSTDTTSIRFNKLLGYAYYKSGDPTNACTYLKDATSLGDSTAFVFKFLGISNYLRLDFAGAIEALNWSLFKDSLDAEVHFFLGSSLATTKEKTTAIYHLDRSMELMQPDTIVSSRIYAEKGNIRRLQDNYEEAYLFYTMSWEANRKDLMSLYLMASIQDNSMHNSKKALEDYELFIEKLDLVTDEKRQMPSVRRIVEDRIIMLKEELFFLDEK